MSEEIHSLQMFLANPQHPHNLILFHLKTDIHKIKGFEAVMGILITHCLDALDKGRWVLHSERHCLLRSIPYLMYLLDAEKKEDSNNAFRSKYFKLERVLKVYKHTPILPLLYDMKINVIETVLQRCAHWDQEEMQNKWLTQNALKIAGNQYTNPTHRTPHFCFC